MSSRKTDHIELTSSSQISNELKDIRFDYEPLFGVHPIESDIKKLKCRFAGFEMGAPVWISSMTGGEKRARELNKVLATIAGEFGFGMGTGSARVLLEDSKLIEDFSLRPYLGNNLPYFINFGIAQIDSYLKNQRIDEILQLVHKLKANGVIIHINPLQEWYQKEGDRYSRPSIEIIEEWLQQTNIKTIVKEVGQGMGPRSLDKLMRLPLLAVDFAAFGGTNFSKLEALRSNDTIDDSLIYVGHTAHEMVEMINKLYELYKNDYKCMNFIISGGLRSFLDGHYLRNSLNCESICGFASIFLNQALRGEEALRTFAKSQLLTMLMAQEFLVNTRS